MHFLESNDQYLEYAKLNKDKFIEAIIEDKIPDDEKMRFLWQEVLEQVKQKWH